MRQSIGHLIRLDTNRGIMAILDRGAATLKDRHNALREHPIGRGDVLLNGPLITKRICFYYCIKLKAV